MNKPLKAVTNIIELKPGKKYLFVFSSEKNMPELMQDAEDLLKMLKEEGIQGIGLALRKGDKLEVIEVEEEKSGSKNNL